MAGKKVSVLVAQSPATVAALNTLLPTARIVDVTTGAAPVDITLADYENWMTLAVRVTSGGTAGVEVLNFIGPADGDATYTLPGKTINVVFVEQVNPSDVVHITQNTDGHFSCIDSLGNAVGTFNAGVFDEEGNNITFGFNGDVILQYRWNCLYGAWNTNTIITQKRNPLPAGGSFGQILVSEGSNATWASSPEVPFPVFNAGSVSALNTGNPASSNPRGMAVVYDADTPVAGSVVTGGGSSASVVISNGTDYIVMFVFP